MQLKKIISVVGARPNFIKVAPIHKAFLKYKNQVNHLICHTGQHFDEKMSKVFFEELELPKPDFYLGVGGGSHADQTARIMIEFEQILLNEKPDLIMVYGDVNSTLACSVTASKLNIPIAHVESGLRSFDRAMPEEVNRIVTDVLADYLFVTEKSGLINLKHEGIDDIKVFFTGNVMIDSLVYYLSKINDASVFNNLKIDKKKYILVTFHRPSNVDNEDNLKSLVAFLNNLAEKLTVVLPIHPRTRNNLGKFGLLKSFHENLILTDPIGYIDFLALIKNATLIVTDSGGIQEESTYLGIPCITVRDNTERPVTVEVGTNQLIGTDLNNVLKASMEVLSGITKNGAIPELWDGKAAERISEKIVELLNK